MFDKILFDIADYIEEMILWDKISDKFLCSTIQTINIKDNDRNISDKIIITDLIRNVIQGHCQFVNVSSKIRKIHIT